MPGRAFYFGRTAAALHRLPLPRRFSAETHLHIGVAAGSRRIDAIGVVGHHVRIDPFDVGALGDLPVSTAARTWRDLAASGLRLAELVAVGDRIVWHRSPRSTVHKLRAAIGRYESRRGIRLLRTAVDMLSDRSDSAPESELRVAILEAGFPPPEVNVERPFPGVTVHPDLSWLEQRVAIEYDGEHHRTNAGQWHRDIRRDQGYRDAAWSCYRATSEDYASPHRLLFWLARHLPRDPAAPRKYAFNAAFNTESTQNPVLSR